MRNRKFLSVLVWLLLAYVAQAQEDTFSITPIRYGETVSETLTQNAFYDWWVIDLQAGERILVTMQANEGLVPLLGVLDENNELLARSDENGIATPNATIRLTFEVKTTGEHRIIATRDGNANGISTGSYQLTLTALADIAPRDNNRPEVSFRCGENIVTHALTLAFSEEQHAYDNGDIERYELLVMGIDGFMPIIRARADIQEAPLDCTNDSGDITEIRLDMPDVSAVIADSAHIARLTLINTDSETILGRVTFTIGSLNNTRGRYVAVLSGLRISPREDLDEVLIQLAPLAKMSPVTVFMIAEKSTRLDSLLTYWADENTESVCDDAGRGTCSEAPALTTSQLLVNGETFIQGGRFDSALTLDPQTTEALAVLLSSRQGETSGDYAIVIVGELPE